MPIVELTFFPDKFSITDLLYRKDERIIYANNGTFDSPIFVSIGGSLDGIFGDGSDGAATNPALVGGDYKQYTNLTIDANTTWAGVGNIIVRVSGILDIQSGFTLTLDNGAILAAKGGLGGANGGNGGTSGDGADSKGFVVIIADTVIGTGTITSTGIDGSNGGNGGGVGSGGAGSSGEDGGIPKIFTKKFTPAGGGTTAVAGPAGTDYGVTDKSQAIEALNFLAHVENGGGAGGAGGTEGSFPKGPGGGAGAGNPIAKGGKGGIGGQDTGSHRTGGAAGGGGSSALFALITKTVTAITVNLTGGDGGDGGTGTGAGNGGGGGGGAGVGWLLIAAIDNAIGALTGGAAGSNGSGGTAPDAGTTRKVFITWTDFKNLLTQGL